MQSTPFYHAHRKTAKPLHQKSNNKSNANSSSTSAPTPPFQMWLTRATSIGLAMGAKRRTSPTDSLKLRQSLARAWQEGNTFRQRQWAIKLRKMLPMSITHSRHQQLLCKLRLQLSPATNLPKRQIFRMKILLQTPQMSTSRLKLRKLTMPLLSSWPSWVVA